MSSRTPPDPNKIAIVTVHGTGDVATSLDGQKWFQRGSAFTQRLVQRLAANGIQAEIVPVLWSGANSSQGRERGAGILAKAVRATSRRYGGVHVIGHSHGGNVANEAASMLGWKLRKKKKPMMTSVTTVGTPFFKTQLGNAESFGGIAFLAITVISILALLVAALATIGMTAELPKHHLNAARYEAECSARLNEFSENTSPDAVPLCVASAMQAARFHRGMLTFLGLLVPVSAVALFIIVPLAVQGFWRIMRARRKRKEDAKFFSIWHPNDEAIAFLQRVEELPIQPFPRWSIWRNSRTSAIVWGVRAVLAVAFLAVAASVAAALRFDAKHAIEQLDQRYNTDLASLVGVSTSDLAVFFAVVAILGAPLIFGLAYLLTRLFLGLGLEFVARGWLNSSIASVLRGMAFGRDGDISIGRVATQSHTYGVEPLILQGDVAERMRAAAAGAAAALIEKYRWALFTVGPDTNGAISRLANDAMTWDSLIHTTYFDQPEVADAIADYIARQAKEGP